MIIDDRLEFADATALSTADVGVQLVGDVVDLGTDGLNDVDELYLVIQVDTAVTSSAGCEVAFSLASDAQAAIAVDGTATVHYTSAAIAKASLTAGTTVARVELPKGQYERYLGILANVTTTKVSAGKINAFLTPNPVTAKSFASPSQA